LLLVLQGQGLIGGSVVDQLEVRCLLLEVNRRANDPHSA